MVISQLPPSKPPVSTLTHETLDKFCNVLRLLGDPTRLRILLDIRRQGERNVTQLCCLLQQTQPAVSYHLALMRAAGILTLRREGKHNFYSVRTALFAQLMDALALQRQGPPRCESFLECMMGDPGACQEEQR